MRILLAFSMAFLWMCGSDDPLPPAGHGGVVVAVGSQPLELVTHADGHVAAFPIGTSTARGPSTSVIVQVPGVDGRVHATPLVWDEPTVSFVGTMPVAPRMGPIEVDAIVAGAPVHASAPLFVVLAPTVPVVVGTAPSTVDVRVAHDRGRSVEVVAPSRPVVVIEPPRPGIFIEPPRPGFVVIEPGRGHGDHERHDGEHGDHDDDHGRHGWPGGDDDHGGWHVGGEGHGHGDGD